MASALPHVVYYSWKLKHGKFESKMRVQDAWGEYERESDVLKGLGQSQGSAKAQEVLCGLMPSGDQGHHLLDTLRIFDTIRQLHLPRETGQNLHESPKVHLIIPWGSFLRPVWGGSDASTFGLQ